jgi:hypothetical protein
MPIRRNLPIIGHAYCEQSHTLCKPKTARIVIAGNICNTEKICNAGTPCNCGSACTETILRKTGFMGRPDFASRSVITVIPALHLIPELGVEQHYL